MLNGWEQNVCNNIHDIWIAETTKTVHLVKYSIWKMRITINFRFTKLNYVNLENEFQWMKSVEKNYYAIIKTKCIKIY